MRVRCEVQLVVGNSSFRSSVENTTFCKHLCTVRGDICSVVHTTQIAASGTDTDSQVKLLKMRILCRLSMISFVHGNSDL
jgi:hypothetical protein